MTGVLNALLGDNGSTASPYVGPGDVLSGAICWYGLRAYSSAKIGTNAVRLIRASDSTQQDFITVSGGGLDMTSVTSFLNATTGKVVTLYDQTGNGLDVTQSNNANRQPFSLNVLGSFPSVQFNSALTSNLTSASPPSAQAQPWTASFVAKRSGTAQGAVIVGQNSPVVEAGFGSGANLALLYAGNLATTAASDAATHAIQCIANGASSVINVDGSASTVDANTRGIPATAIVLGDDGFGAYLNGNFYEAGFWPLGFSSGQQSSMNSNQHAYWGF